MNTNNLKAEVTRSGMSIEEFLYKINSKGIKMSKSSYYKRLRGTYEFDRKEILVITDVLNLSKQQMNDIFFGE
ncbi:BetR domain protein [Staphylococcus edaphicus]|uniref:BetR domain protein n=1 Tax=Staphylococcus edaphicus TaxID=1955013 RepID=A0A2C6WSJ1_9STAP|nr:BetR domain protein [Staphylococcus edaphicus]PHK50754.1 BetR domain protein [Staphylococcus edaphicus]UQW82443.1 BetR domain protein [Staphylococcus edaphicus]